MSFSLSNTSPLRAARHTSSASVSAARPSPSAMPVSAPRASASSGNGLPSIASARANSFSIAAASSERKTSTRARERSAALSSKEGFSVVAPTSTTVPSSITGRNESCWARLKRCTSSTNRSVPLPVSRRARAASNTFFRSATPENTAEICSKCRSVASASSRATVVLPVPGGPQNTSEPSERVTSMRVSAPSGPSRWSWPTTSASFSGRNLSASGRGASRSRPAAAKRRGLAAGFLAMTQRWPRSGLTASGWSQIEARRRLSARRKSGCRRQGERDTDRDHDDVEENADDREATAVAGAQQRDHAEHEADQMSEGSEKELEHHDARADVEPRRFLRQLARHDEEDEEQRPGQDEDPDRDLDRQLAEGKPALRRIGRLHRHRLPPRAAARRVRSAPEHHRDLLSLAHDRDPPQPNG